MVMTNEGKEEVFEPSNEVQEEMNRILDAIGPGYWLGLVRAISSNQMNLMMTVIPHSDTEQYSLPDERQIDYLIAYAPAMIKECELVQHTVLRMNRKDESDESFINFEVQDPPNPGEETYPDYVSGKIVMELAVPAKEEFLEMMEEMHWKAVIKISKNHGPDGSEN